MPHYRAFFLQVAFEPDTIPLHLVARYEAASMAMQTAESVTHIADPSHMADAIELLETWIALVRRMDACHKPLKNIEEGS